MPETGKVVRVTVVSIDVLQPAKFGTTFLEHPVFRNQYNPDPSKPGNLQQARILVDLQALKLNLI